MAEYIEREELIEHLAKNIVCLNKDSEDCKEVMLDGIMRFEKSDVEPVKHGEWLNFCGDYSTAECNQCGELYEVSPDEKPNDVYLELFKQEYRFCPNCGARMDGDKK